MAASKHDVDDVTCAIQRLTADEHKALEYIYRAGGRVMPSTEAMAHMLQSLGSMMSYRETDLVVQRRGGVSDPHFLGSNIFEITDWGRRVAERAFGLSTATRDEESK